jgi:hypothetical protein
MENTTEYDNSMMNVNNTVTEITNIISQHLTKVFDQVANKNNNISQNLKILNQLSFVVELRKENQDLKQQLNDISTKYKSCLEELVTIKSQTKVTMEITELDSINNTSILSRDEIESTIKNTQHKSLWDLQVSDDDSEQNDSEDSDAQSMSYVSNFNNINKLDSESSLKFTELREHPKNKDVSAEEIKTAIDRWKLFYNITVNGNKSEDDIINDIMDSSAGLKGWSEESYDMMLRTEDAEVSRIMDGEDEDIEAAEDAEAEADEDDDAEADEDDDAEADEDDDAEADEDDDAEDEDAEDAEDEDAEDAEDAEAEDDEDEDAEDEDAEDAKAEDEGEDEAEGEDEGEYEDVKNVAVAKTVLLAQEAGEYATIDTASEEEDEEVEVEEFKFENKIYYTDDAQNGNLFECLEDGEIGDIVGNLENGSVFFS